MTCRIRHSRWQATLACPRTRRWRPPNGSFRRLFTRSTVVRPSNCRSSGSVPPGCLSRRRHGLHLLLALRRVGFSAIVGEYPSFVLHSPISGASRTLSIKSWRLTTRCAVIAVSGTDTWPSSVDAGIRMQLARMPPSAVSMCTLQTMGIICNSAEDLSID